MFEPLVTIIIPCYNQDQFLAETLQSVLAQTYANWECVIIDDGSTDGSARIAKQSVCSDTRFKYIWQENKGVSVARNTGLANATGDYIQFLDADDLLVPEKLLVSIQAVQKHNVSVVCTNYALFTTSVNTIAPPFSNLEQFELSFYNLARFWNDGLTMPPHCWFFNANLLVGLSFPVGLTAQEDWVMWLKIFLQSPKTFYIEKHLALYRLNPNGRTQTGDFFSETLEAIHYLKGFLSVDDFRLLYESAIIRNNIGMLYWRKRELNLKKSNTYQCGLLCKKVIKKIGLLAVAKAVFVFLNPLK